MSAVFDFTSYPTLTTKRLILRQITRDDADGMMAIFSSPEVLRYLNDLPVDTRDKAIGMIDWFSGLYDKHEAVQWGITLPSSDSLIGMCGNYGWDRENRYVDIGYHILPSQWGKGYATEAARAIIGWTFDHFDVHRIQADCTDGNIGSERVLLKCGFKVEGLWRERCWEHGRFVDIKQFGLLRREFTTNVR
jgi:[ribosomal protein S5]-alanine N-acetyltransferase